jgi:hypothetical protein
VAAGARAVTAVMSNIDAGAIAVQNKARELIATEP